MISGTKMKEISYNKFTHYFTGFVNWISENKQGTPRDDGFYFIIPGKVVVPINRPKNDNLLNPDDEKKQDRK